MKNVAAEFKALFATRKYSVRNVQIIVNFDGKCEGNNMIVVTSDYVGTLQAIERDLSRSKMFTNASITEQWDHTAWLSGSGDSEKVMQLTMICKAE